MSEQAEKLWVDNILPADVRDLAERAVVVELGTLSSNQSDDGYAIDKVRMSSKIDRLLPLLGVNSEDWHTHITATERIRYGYSDRSEHKADAQRRARGIKLGEYVMHRSYWAIPIEGDDGESGSFKVSLTISDNLEVAIQADGTHWVVRKYIDPKTREEVAGNIDELEERSMNGELETDLAGVHTGRSFRVTFNKPNTPQPMSS